MVSLVDSVPNERVGIAVKGEEAIDMWCEKEAIKNSYCRKENGWN